MEFAPNITLSALCQQLLVGLSRTTILFIVSSGLSLVLGVLRIPNLSHGSLYMIGAFLGRNLYQCITVCFFGAAKITTFATCCVR